MELSNEFTVDAPVDQAWAVLTDLERIAPCMPGAYSRLFSGDFARPQRFTPRRRSILCFAAIRFDIL